MLYGYKEWALALDHKVLEMMDVFKTKCSRKIKPVKYERVRESYDSKKSIAEKTRGSARIV